MVHQGGDSLSISIGIPKKLDSHLIVFAPAYDGDVDIEGTFYFKGLDV